MPRRNWNANRRVEGGGWNSTALEFELRSAWNTNQRVVHALREQRRTERQIQMIRTTYGTA